jgi:hypothetical protein
MKLTKQALFTLAAEEVLFGAGHDALDRVCALVLPFLKSRHGEAIVPSSVQHILKQQYALAISADVGHVILGRLAKRALIDSERIDGEVVYASKPTTREEIPQNRSSVDEVLEAFQKFALDRPAIPKLDEDELLQLLREHLFKLDSVVLGATDVAEAREPAWKFGLVSDFVVSVMEPDGSLPPLLKRLSELNLISHAIKQLGNSRERRTSSDAIVILDSPLALQLIGASGSLQRNNVLALTSAGRSLGVRFSVLQDSLSEMSRVLDAVLFEDHRNRQGPTASALRRNEVSETIVRDMQRDPRKYLRSKSVSILPYTINTHPEIHSYFPHPLYREFCGYAGRWAMRTEAQDHDAGALAITQRLRKGVAESSVFSAKYSFVTTNWTFRNEAQRFCEEKHLTNSASLPPIIHITDFAASVWLAAGFEQDGKIPERTLLATCERVLASGLKPIANISDAIKGFMEIDDDQLELLIRDRDAISTITSLIAGDPTLINSTNVLDIVRRAKEAVAREISDEKNQLIDAHRAENEKLEALLSQQSIDFESRIAHSRIEAQTEVQEVLGKFSELQEATKRAEALTREELTSREVRIKQLEDVITEERRREIQGVRNRISEFEHQYLTKVSGQATLFFLLLPTFASILTAYSATLFGGVALLFLTIVLGILGHFRIGPVHRFSMWWRKRAADKGLRQEFSGAEIQQWKLELNDKCEVVSGASQLAS